jgi:hypothetical protein
MADPFYLQSTFVSGSLEIELWATAGTQVEGVDFTAQYDPASGIFASFNAPTGWLSTSNPTSGNVAVSEIGLSPIAVTADELVGTLSFTPEGSAGKFDTTITVSDWVDEGNVEHSAVNLPSVAVQICFVTGTKISTPSGEVPIEHLNVGDSVMTLGGAARSIVWIGVGRVLVARGRRSAATPVIIRKGALAENVPAHDLHVTKSHSLYLDGVLVPAEFLVNHRSIIWDDWAQEVKIYHIELETHDVLFANGAAAESYRDDGNRWLFQNYPSMQPLRAHLPYAPVVTGGEILDAIWKRLLDRSGPRPGQPLTDDPDLHLLVDGTRLDFASRHDSVYVFRLFGHPEAVKIVSRAGAPAELGWARDPRVLGVAVRRIAVREGKRFRVINAADSSLRNGFYPVEAGFDSRWTDGSAEVPSALFDGFRGPIEVMLHIGGLSRYPMFADATPHLGKTA